MQQCPICCGLHLFSDLKSSCPSLGSSSLSPLASLLFLNHMACFCLEVIVCAILTTQKALPPPVPKWLLAHFCQICTQSCPFKEGYTGHSLALHNQHHLYLMFTVSLPYLYFPDSSAGKESACNLGDPGSIPGLGRSAGEGRCYLLPSILGLPRWLSW